MNFNISNATSPELVAQMLAKNGFRRARIEIGWGSIDFRDETKLVDAAQLSAKLLALKQFGIRPLILLNANQGLPCPAQVVNRTVTLKAAAGATQLTLNDVSELRVGYSGLSNLSGYWAAESLITRISGNTITLSKPLLKAINEGTSVSIATLKYRPFSQPGSSDYQATIAGWQRYVNTVAQFASDILGAQNRPDKGFDLEIWNELSFGSNFLNINRYYAEPLYPSFQRDQTEEKIWDGIVTATADFADSHSDLFQGVVISNGFANTIPWTASSQQPKRLNAISKHPYNNRINYPQDQVEGKHSTGHPVNALLQPEDKSSTFIPAYSALFPEYYATALQTETIIRDMAPISTDIYGTMHGRNARKIDNQILPTPVWITEINTSPIEDNPNITAERARTIKEKTASRSITFYLNKGATQLYFYGAADSDLGLGMVQENFINYATQAGATYPSNDATYTSPVLATVKRIVSAMSDQLDPNLTSTRQLQLISVTDTHNHYQFVGDGTPAHPTLYDHDVFTFLPYQVNEHKFVVPYYVMTRDVMKDLPPETFTIEVKGFNGDQASVTAYDPMANRNVPTTVLSRSSDSMVLSVIATDYPYLLEIQE